MEREIIVQQLKIKRHKIKFFRNLLKRSVRALQVKNLYGRLYNLSEDAKDIAGGLSDLQKDIENIKADVADMFNNSTPGSIAKKVKPKPRR